MGRCHNRLRDSKNIKQLAETVGALQDTLRINSDAIRGLADQQYGVIISLDLIFMELVSLLPEDQKRDILQNQFDESLSEAQNDLAALVRVRNYFNRRIADCKKFIIDRGNEEKKI